MLKKLLVPTSFRYEQRATFLGLKIFMKDVERSPNPWWRETIDGEKKKQTKEDIAQADEDLREDYLFKFFETYHFHRWDTSFKGINFFFRRKMRKIAVEKSTLDYTRLEQLGADISAAMFYIKYYGSVKFVGRRGFISIKSPKEVLNQIPNKRDPNFQVEALELSEMASFVYESLNHLQYLKHLKWISFKGLKTFDNWCFDRLCVVAPNLEFLDISGCTNIDHYAFHGIYRLKRLKCINVADISDTPEFRLTCLTVEAEHPSLVFLGIVERKRPKKKSAFLDSK